VVSGPTLLINGFDLDTVAGIASWDGLLDTGDPRGDLIVFDFADGAVWVPAGGFEPHQIVVPVVMRATPEDAAIADVLALESYLGVEVTLTRRALLDGVLTDHTCRAYMSARPTRWELDVLGRVPVDLTFQALSNWVPA
jgi:hypothetical protein